MKICENLIW